jgi:hypothetical protein
MAKQLKLLFEQEKHKSCDDDYASLTSAQLRDLLSAYGITGISQYSRQELCEMATFVQPDILILSESRKKNPKNDSGKDGNEAKNVKSSKAKVDRKTMKEWDGDCGPGARANTDGKHAKVVDEMQCLIRSSKRASFHQMPTSQRVLDELKKAKIRIIPFLMHNKHDHEPVMGIFYKPGESARGRMIADQLKLVTGKKSLIDFDGLKEINQDYIFGRLMDYSAEAAREYSFGTGLRMIPLAWRSIPQRKWDSDFLADHIKRMTRREAMADIAETVFQTILKLYEATYPTDQLAFPLSVKKRLMNA